MAESPGPAGPKKDDAPGLANGKADDASVLRLLAAASTVGFEFLAAVLLPTGLGYWLDGKLGTRPVLMIVLGVFGFGVGLWRMLKTASAGMK